MNVIYCSCIRKFCVVWAINDFIHFNNGKYCKLLFARIGMLVTYTTILPYAGYDENAICETDMGAFDNTG